MPEPGLSSIRPAALPRSPERSVVFVHGLWVTADSWRGFRERWEAAGWTVHAPTWRILEGLDAASLNRSPPAALGATSVKQIVDGYDAYIRALPDPPLILGHSFGGLFAQMLLDRGLGRAGVAVNPAPIAGVLHGWLTLTAALPALLRWRGWSRPYALSRERWAGRFANTAPPAVQDGAYDSYVIPTSGRVFYEAAFWIGTQVDPRRRRVPLLITGSDGDRLVTPYVSRAAWRIQRRSHARTDLQLFPGRSHLLLAEPGWEEIADALIDWSESVQSPAEPPYSYNRAGADEAMLSPAS
jgi:alpha-beta hydrolase superfamily lysophospholipase